MISKRSVLTLFCVLAAFSMIAAQCVPVAPSVVEKVVTVEVEVEAESPFTIGYAAPSLAGGQIDIQEGVVRQAEAKGWQVVTTNANGDPQRQNDDIDYFISLGVDAIVTVPFDSAGICAAAEKAKEAAATTAD